MATRILVVDDSPTIRRVVCSILERQGYDAAQAIDGEDALEALVSGEVKADLLLVDFVMPRLNGYQLCRELRARPELAAMPVVLMSAKGDRIREQFVSQTGALDAITKPFDPRALVAVIENALRRASAGRGSSARLPELIDDEAPRGPDAETKRAQIAQIVASKLAHLASRVLAEVPDATPGRLAGMLSERLSKEALIDMIGAIRDADAADMESLVIAGDLGIVPIGAVLQLLQVENQSGVLLCRSGEARVRATFRDGLIDLVQSEGAGDEFRLGRFFVEQGLVTPEEIDEVLVRARERRARGISSGEMPAAEPHGPESRVLPKSLAPDTLPVGSADRVTFPSGEPSTKPGVAPPPLGAQTPDGVVPAPTTTSPVPESEPLPPLGSLLVESGKITEGHLREALVAQSSELLYEVLRWTRGRFELRKQAAAPLVTSARLGMSIASIVMEGFRRVDEWRVIERTLGSFDGIVVKEESEVAKLDLDALPKAERAVLDAITGERTIRDVVSASHMSSFDACRTLAQFIEARVVRRRAP
ncbi:MAG: response regulator [Myxococcales bacterium]|nr:response regulator [Myxococcales bacterium]